MGRETFSVESYHAARRTYGVDHAVGVTKRAEQQARETGHLSEIVDPAINPIRFSKIRLNPHQSRWIATLHKGFSRFTGKKKFMTELYSEMDGDCPFYDDEYRRIATMLYAKYVLIPKGGI